MNQERKKHAEKPFSKNFHKRISLIRTKSFKVTLKKRSRDKNRFQNSFSLMTWILNKLITRCCQVSNSQEFCWNYLGVSGEIPLKKDNWVVNAQQCFADIYYHWTQGCSLPLRTQLYPFNPRIIVLAQFELSIFCLFLPKYI